MSTWNSNPGYDAVGNIVGYTDTVNGAWTSILPDSLNRIVSASFTPHSGGSATNMCWSYDSFGNRAAQSQQAGACPAQGAGGPGLALETWETMNPNPPL
jgi:hypothetical protein